MTAVWGDERLSPLFWESISPEPNSGCWLRTGSNKSFAPIRRHAYRSLIGHLDNDDYLESSCGGQCVNPAHTRRRSNATAAERSANKKRAYRNLPKRIRQKYWLRWRYGISVDEYDRMFAAQGGRCAICRTAFGTDYKTCGKVDHCHITGRVRALLCTGCNTGLGCLRDDPALLRAAANYVEKHKEPS